MTTAPTDQFNYKVVFIGPDKVGKTALTTLIADSTRPFIPAYTPTIGASFLAKRGTHNGHAYKFEMWYVNYFFKHYIQVESHHIGLVSINFI